MAEDTKTGKDFESLVEHIQDISDVLQQDARLVIDSN